MRITVYDQFAKKKHWTSRLVWAGAKKYKFSFFAMRRPFKLTSVKKTYRTLHVRLDEKHNNGLCEEIHALLSQIRKKSMILKIDSVTKGILTLFQNIVVKGANQRV